MTTALIVLAVLVAGIYLIRGALGGGLSDSALDAMERAASEREAEERAEDAVWERVKADTSREWPDHFTPSEQAMADRAARRERLREEVARAMQKAKP